MTGVAVAGAGITRHGFFPARSWKDLIVEASLAAVADAGMDLGRIDGGMVSCTLPETFEQQNLGAVTADELGLTPVPFGQLVGACAGGLMAVQAGIRMIQSGAHRCVLVAGVEKQSDTTTTADSMLSYVDADFEAAAGFDFVDTMALMHARYLQVHGTSEEAVAAFAVADRWYARHNPVAVDTGRPDITTADVLDSGWVSKPITRAACGRACDGSSAVVLVAADEVPDAPVIAGIAQATGPNGLAAKFGHPGYDGDIVRALPTAIAADSAYRQAGIGAGDVDVAQVHDCFTIMGSLHLEGLGIFPAGKAALAVQAGETALDGRCPANTDGGRIGLGHPTGTTGINVVVESVRQLRREAGVRQVRDPEVAVCQAMGGNNSTSAVAVLRRATGRSRHVGAE